METTCTARTTAAPITSCEKPDRQPPARYNGLWDRGKHNREANDEPCVRCRGVRDSECLEREDGRKQYTNGHPGAARLAGRETIGPEDLREVDWVAVHQGFPLERAIEQLAASGGSEARIVHRINEFFVAAAVVAASDCVALRPRYTTDMQLHPELVLRPISPLGPGRHIECLARPESLERASVKTVLAQIRAVVANIASPAPT